MVQWLRIISGTDEALFVSLQHIGQPIHRAREDCFATSEYHDSFAPVPGMLIHMDVLRMTRHHSLGVYQDRGMTRWRSLGNV